jgi:hypothetical protein
MALTTFVIYDTSTGEIHHVRNADDGAAPTPPAGHANLDIGLTSPKPGRKTHKVDLVGPSVVAKTGGELQSDADAARKLEIEYALVRLDSDRQNAQSRGFTGIRDAMDAEITALEAEHASLP